MKTEIDTLETVSAVSGLKANRSADAAVFLRTEMDAKDNSYKSNLYLLRNGCINRLSAGGEESDFVFEDNETILFPAARSKTEKEGKEAGLAETSFYRLSLNGGEAVPAFSIPLNVSRLESLADGRYIVEATVASAVPDLYLKSREDRLKYAKGQKEGSFALEAEEIPFWFNSAGFISGQYSRLFLFDPKETAAEKALRPLTEENYDLNGFYLHPDRAKLLCFGSYRSARVSKFNSLYEYDLLSGRRKEIVPDDYLAIQGAFYLQDEIYLLASDMKKLGLNQNALLYKYSEAEASPVILSELEIQIGNSVGTDVNYGRSQPFFVADDAVYFLETIWHRSLLMRLSASGKIEACAQVNGSITGFAFVEDLLYVSAFHDMQTSEIYKLTAYSAEQRSELITDAMGNEAPFLSWPECKIEQISTFNLAVPVAVRPERFTFEHEGINLEGFVLLPPAARDAAAKSFPAILDIHGGPKTVYGDIYFHEMQFWLSRGYIVIYTNPRGSDGRGDAFSDIFGDYGGRDYRDIMAFVDQCLERYPQIDPERMGVTGGSYGGFMTNWIVTQTDRFKAAAAQRSISNWTSFYGVSDIGFRFAFDQNKTGWQDANAFSILWDHSPLKYVRQAETPTLILHSEEDYRCPLEQGVQFFTGLIDKGLEAKLVIFKGENHELSRSGKPKARKKRLEEITRWFDQYVR